MAELVWLKTNFQPDHIWFADDILGLKPGWIERFATLLRAADAVPEMRQRLTPDGAVEEWAQLDASPTVLRADDSFAFARLRYASRLRDFAPPALAARAVLCLLAVAGVN